MVQQSPTRLVRFCELSFFLGVAGEREMSKPFVHARSHFIAGDLRCAAIRKELGQMLLGPQIPARGKRIVVGIRKDLRGVEQQLLAPDEPRLLTESDDVVEESLKEGKPEPLSD